MEQKGRKEAPQAAQNASQGLRALDRGDQAKALDAMNRVAQHAASRGGERKGASTSSGQAGRTPSEQRQRRQQGARNPSRRIRGEQGVGTGKGPSDHPQGEATPRWTPSPDFLARGRPAEAAEGQHRNQHVRPRGRVPSRLPVGSAFEQYSG